MKFKCTCGFVVVEQGRSDHIMGQVLRAQSFAAAVEEPCDTIAEFMRAINEGKREEWVGRFYGKPAFIIADREVVCDILLHARERAGLDIYQCESCGRIFIERTPQSGAPMRCFKPEDPDWKGTLADPAGA